MNLESWEFSRRTVGARGTSSLHWRILLVTALAALVTAAVAPSVLASRQRVLRHVRAWALGSQLLEDRGVVFQANDVTCGHACLMTALRRLRREIPPDLVELAGRARVGLTAPELVALSRQVGLPARALAVPANCLERALVQIPLPSIALVGTHYVLIEEPPSAGFLVVVDPAIGRMRTPIARLVRQWRGVMVVLGENAGAATVCQQP